MTLGMSMTVYATTICRAEPVSPPKPLVITMARGAATLALVHSSERWNGASNLLDKNFCQCKGSAYRILT